MTKNTVVDRWIDNGNGKEYRLVHRPGMAPAPYHYLERRLEEEVEGDEDWAGCTDQLILSNRLAQVIQRSHLTSIPKSK